MTTYGDDEKEVWKQFRRELIGDGTSSDFIHKHKPRIKRYLHELAEKGELDEHTREDADVVPEEAIPSVVGEMVSSESSTARSESPDEEQASSIDKGADVGKDGLVDWLEASHLLNRLASVDIISPDSFGHCERTLRWNYPAWLTSLASAATLSEEAGKHGESTQYVVSFACS